jgi:GT2 family glycosyltransferase
VSIVIPTNGGRAEIIDRTLRVVLADPATSEVIVAFDRDDPETRALSETYARSDARVKCIRTDETDFRHPSRGQHAREAGVGVASGEVVLALDDDVEPKPGLVSGHARRHASTGSDSVVVGYMPVDTSTTSGPVRLYSEAYEQACSRFIADPRNILTSPGLWGGNFSLPRRRWLETARLPARVETGYHVDQEFGFRLLKGGSQAVFDPQLRAIHRYQRSQAGLLRDAQSSGESQARLHTAYPELVNPTRDTLAAARLAGRPLVWLTRSRLGWRISTTILLGMARISEKVGLRRADYAIARLLWRIGFARGAQRGAHGIHVSAGS